MEQRYKVGQKVKVSEQFIGVIDKIIDGDLYKITYKVNAKDPYISTVYFKEGQFTAFEQTNEDWLKSLSTKALADVLNKIAYCEGQIICDDEPCEQCNLYTYCHTDWESPSYEWWLRAIKKD